MPHASTRTTAPTDRASVLAALSRARLFRGMDPRLLERLATGAQLRTLAQGERAWIEGDPAEHFHVVLRGVLELQRLSGGVGTSLVALLGPGEAAAVSVTMERDRYVATAVAATEAVSLLRVGAGPILDELDRDPRLAMAMNRALLDECRLLRAKADVLASGSVPCRLAALLIDLDDRFGDELEDGTHFVPLALTRTQLATYVCARVETVIRVCTAWQRAGLLETTPGGFRISCMTCLFDTFQGAAREEVAARLASGCSAGTD